MPVTRRSEISRIGLRVKPVPSHSHAPVTTVRIGASSQDGRISVHTLWIELLVNQTLLTGDNGLGVIWKVRFAKGHHGVFDFLAAGGQFGADLGETKLHFGAKLFQVLVEASGLDALFGLAGLNALEMGQNHVDEQCMKLCEHVLHGLIVCAIDCSF